VFDSLSYNLSLQKTLRIFMQILFPICLENLQGSDFGIMCTAAKLQICDEVYKLILSQRIAQKNN